MQRAKRNSLVKSANSVVAIAAMVIFLMAPILPLAPQVAYSVAEPPALPEQCPGGDYNVIAASDSPTNGTNGNDFIYADDNNENNIDGKGGDDCILVGSGNSGKLDGGNGEDVIVVGDNNSGLIKGENNEDIIDVGDNNKKDVIGGNGDDEITIGDNNEGDVTGGGGDDVITVGCNNSGNIDGNQGNNEITVGGDCEVEEEHNSLKVSKYDNDSGEWISNWEMCLYSADYDGDGENFEPSGEAIACDETGDELSPAEFSLDRLESGWYVVDEEERPGWQFVGWDGDVNYETSNEELGQLLVEIEAENNYEITFYNQPESGHIVIRKVAYPEPEDGQEFDFILDNDEGEIGEEISLSNGDSGTFDVTPGTYTISETAPEGWRLENIACEYEGDSVGVAASSGETVTVDADETVTCTFTNIGADQTIITGHKWEDTNGNGEQDDGEPARKDWNIALGRVGERLEPQEPAGPENKIPIEIVALSLTGADGWYYLPVTQPGEYKVFEEKRNGWDTTNPPAVDSFFDIEYRIDSEPSLNIDSFFDVFVDAEQSLFGQTITHDMSGNLLDFGNFELVDITGLKWNDENGDGVREGERGLGDVIVALGRQNGESRREDEHEVIPIEIIAMDLTSNLGDFTISSIGPGHYKLFEEKKSGWQATNPKPRRADSFFDISYDFAAIGDPDFDLLRVIGDPDFDLLRDSFFDVFVELSGEDVSMSEATQDLLTTIPSVPLEFGNSQSRGGEEDHGPDWAEIFEIVRDALLEEGINTNIVDCANDPTACVGLYFEEPQFGKITFPGPLDLTDDATIETLQSLEDGNINFENGEISFDAQTEDVFKELGGTLEMYGLDFEVTPTINVDGEPATEDDVEGIDYDAETGILTFTAKHFTTFTVSETPSETPVGTCQELQDIDSDTNYYLANDIDCSGFSFTAISSFNATLDGRDHKIKNLTVASTNGSWGLFSGTESDAIIKNIGIEDISITSDGYTGGIVGWNMGLIQNCSVTGKIAANYQEVGGIVGSNQGTIENCYADIDLMGNTYTGGIAGSNKYGKVKNSYVKGTIVGSSNSGGVVGLNAYGGALIQNSYSIASVNAGSGALVGWNYDGGAISGSYWSEELAHVSTMCVSGCANENEKTPAELKEQATFSGWDFESIWTIDPAKNGGYPYFKWQTLPNDIQISEEQSEVTSDSVTIAWTTDHPATSRVIWDTISHSDASTTEAGPVNYGYANSTIEDPALVTSHSVLVSGLSSGTQYFFRTVSHGSPEAVGSEQSVTTSPTPSPAPASSGGGGGGSSGGQGGSINPGVGSAQPAQGTVLGVATADRCDLRLNSYIKFGAKNDSNDVKKLQTYLNDFEGENLIITEVYDKATFEAVKRFQVKYWEEVLLSWSPFGSKDTMTPSGYVYKTTQSKINALVCPDNLKQSGQVLGLGAEQNKEIEARLATLYLQLIDLMNKYILLLRNAINQ